jgi:uncharacterized protein (DUF697 family)
MGGGMMPIPLFDIAAVTAIQMDMLKQLAALYGVNYSQSSGKTFASALTGSTFAKIGSSFVKAIPGIGTVFGGISMAALSGASTYAVGQVAISHFEKEGDLLNVDLRWAKEKYDEAYEKGKEFVSDLEEEVKTAKEEPEDILEKIDKLGDLKEKGVISEEEFKEQKKKLLDRL